MKHIFSLFLTLFLFSIAEGQTVTGTVKDGSGLPLPGVNIKVVSTNLTTITDLDGKFTIPATTGENIEFTFTGYATKIVKAASGMNVLIAEEASTLNEVVVVGYGTRKLGAVTGSVSQVKAADIIRTPAQSAIQAIQGKAAGVNIVTNDEPGANPTIRIRGLGTILGARDPLYVIDGVETNGMNGLSPNDIETMDILKDASSLAIYGQKGANGVVIISTKKGKIGKAKVNFNSYYGFKNVQKKVHMADGFRFAYYANSALGSTTYLNPGQPYETDWFDEITQTGEVLSNNMSVSGGSENVNYYFGATNYEEKGILMGTEYRRTNVNSRNEYKLFNDRVKLTQNFNLTLTNGTPKPLSAFTNAYKQSPLVPVQFENGRWGVPLRNSQTGLVDINGDDRFNNVGNPVAQLANTHSENKSVLFFGSVGAEIKLMKNLRFNSNFGATYESYKSYDFVDNQENYLTANATKSESDFAASFGVNPIIYNTLSQTQGTNFLWNWDNYFTLTEDFGKQHLKLVGGMSRTTKNDNDVISGTRRNVPSQPNYWSLSLSDYNVETAPGSVVSGTNSTPIVSLAYFGRLEYDYDNKYLLTAVIRNEGISAFQEDKRFKSFPSVSAGWVVSNEEFMSNSTVVNYMKVRGGYGQVGNGNSPYATNSLVFPSGSNYAFGSNQTIFPGTYNPYQVDPNLTWETMEEVDLGLDFKFLSNRLSATFDAYKRTSKNIIVPISLPAVLSPGRVIVNAGEVENKGLEATLRWDDRIGDSWRYWIGGNFSYNKNQLSKVTNTYFADYIGGSLGNGDFTKQVLVGEPLGSFYVFETTGFDSSGQFTYSDQRVAAGSYIPTNTYGANVGFQFRNIDFSVDIYGVGGNKVFNGKKAQRIGNENIEYDYLDSFWTPSTPNAENPAPINAIPTASTYFIEDGSFLRINNITIGYTFNQLVDKFASVRLYATAVNPFLFTKYSGYSPEISGDGDPLGSAGVELDAYPTNRTYSLGVNISF